MRAKADSGTIEETHTEAGSAEAESPAEEPTEGPSFTPDYKFTVLDQEHEIDEFLRESIKDEDTLGKVKELYEKAYGLDHVKEKLKTTREEFQGTKKEYDALLGELKTVSQHAQRGDFDSFFKEIGIPEEKVLQWVLDKVNYEQMTPEQKQAVDAQRQAEQRAFQAETQLTQQQQYAEKQAAEATARDIQTVLAQPAVKEFQQKFDSAAGKGAFVDQILIQGELMYDEKTGRAPAAADVAKTVMDRFNGLVMQPSQGQTQAAPTPQQTPSAGGTQTPPQVTKPKEKVIPNMSGRNSSAVKKEVTSIDDLRKLAATFNG